MLQNLDFLYGLHSLFLCHHLENRVPTYTHLYNRQLNEGEESKKNPLIKAP